MTAMQMMEDYVDGLIEIDKKLATEFKDNIKAVGEINDNLRQLALIKEMAITLRKTKEREQIVEARLSVTGLNHASPTDDNSLEEAEQYYSSKYEQK